MIDIYSKNEMERAHQQKRKTLRVFFSVFAVFLFAIITLYVFYLQEPAENVSTTNAMKWSFSAVSIIFFIWGYLYLIIKYSRVRKYYNVLYYIRNGIREKNEGTFVRFSKDKKEKDGVDFYSMVLLEWSDKEQDFLERYVLLDVEKEFPPFKKGDKLYYITQSNILVSWEINN